MAMRTRAIAGVVTALTACGAMAALHSPSASAAGTRSRQVAETALVVAIDKVGAGTIRLDKTLVVRGTVTNPGRTQWLDAQAYLQISTDPATTLRDLQYYASVPDNPGVGNTIIEYGLFDELGDVAPGNRRGFRLAIPWDKLGIDGEPGVYRVGVKIVAGTAAGRNPADAAHTSTLMPLLASDASTVVPAQMVTLVPLSAPVKRLSDGAFADDSLRALISEVGRLDNVLDWASLAPPGTLQIVMDPALLSAITDMADGYQVQAAQPSTQSVAGAGRAEAESWLARFQDVADIQHLMYLPWGEPAVNSLLAPDHHLPGPVIAAIDSSHAYLRAHPVGTAVAGWLTDGSTGIRAVTVMHHVGVDLQIVSQASLPGLASYARAGRNVPSHVAISAGGRPVHALVTATNLAGLPTTPTTSALQFRQRFLADATVRSLSGHPGQVAVTALPFTWNPGPVATSQGMAQAFQHPVVVAQSAVGALDRSGVTYHGRVRPSATSFRALGTEVVQAIHDLRLSGGSLAEILSPSAVAQSQFQHALAMSGSAQWRVYPQTGVRLITASATAARNRLARVTITGPPFVAMSSSSGRFPLTVTNGLERPITVRISAISDDPALTIAPVDPIQLTPGQQRDVQVVSTAAGSGVTSVRARLTTTDGTRFGAPWRFDVRSTQIGLVIWVVMGVGAAVLFSAAGYRIVKRVRGSGSSRR